MGEVFSFRGLVSAAASKRTRPRQPNDFLAPYFGRI
jgi:hypothetical protein